MSNEASRIQQQVEQDLLAAGWTNIHTEGFWHWRLVNGGGEITVPRISEAYAIQRMLEHERKKAQEKPPFAHVSRAGFQRL